MRFHTCRCLWNRSSVHGNGISHQRRDKKRQGRNEPPQKTKHRLILNVTTLWVPNPKRLCQTEQIKQYWFKGDLSSQISIKAVKSIDKRLWTCPLPKAQQCSNQSVGRILGSLHQLHTLTREAGGFVPFLKMLFLPRVADLSFNDELR